MNQEILEHFKKVDPIIYPWIEKFKGKLSLSPEKPTKYFFKLCRSIAYQQLNGKAAETIWNRFQDLLPDREVDPESVLSLSIETMRTAGLSNAKANYIQNIANAFKTDANYLQLDHLSNEEIIELLTKIKGVGRWTAEMFLMFTIGREDIFSLGDYGLMKGLMKVYSLKNDPDVLALNKKKMERITKKWSPYRTYGSMTLWEVLDTRND